jgi:hypothetical protein
MPRRGPGTDGDRRKMPEAICIRPSGEGAIDLEATARERSGASRAEPACSLFNDKRIAKRDHPRTRAWLALDASWIVTSINSGDVLMTTAGKLLRHA